MIQIMLYFAGKPTEFWNKSSKHSKFMHFAKGWANISYFLKDGQLNVTFADVELIREESMRDSLFLTNERKFGESFA